jgi:hypothetical protein
VSCKYQHTYADTGMCEPTRGASTGIHAYDHSLDPLPGMGSTAWAMRGPKSRAGLAAYAVGPPRPAGVEFKVRLSSRVVSKRAFVARAAAHVQCVLAFDLRACLVQHHHGSVHIDTQCAVAHVVTAPKSQHDSTQASVSQTQAVLYCCERCALSAQAVQAVYTHMPAFHGWPHMVRT